MKTNQLLPPTDRDCLESSEPRGCACITTKIGEEDMFFVTSGQNEDSHKFLLLEVIEAGLRARMSGNFSEKAICKLVSDCTGDLEEQLNYLRERATAQDKLDVMLQDCAHFEARPELMVSLDQIDQYICKVNKGEYYDLFRNSIPSSH